MATMQIKEIKDSNDLLGYLIQAQNDQHECLVTDIFENTKVGNADLKFYVEELVKCDFVHVTSLNVLYITPKGRKGYNSASKKVLLKMKPIFFTVFGYIVGILSNDIRNALYSLFSLIKKFF